MIALEPSIKNRPEFHQNVRVVVKTDGEEIVLGTAQDQVRT